MTADAPRPLRSVRLAGVGVGPSNLSLAALLDTDDTSEVDVFLEADTSFTWHPGMMLPGAEMQVHFLKDLVTPVDPTNPHSFLAHAVEQGVFYPLLNTRRQVVTRREFENYCAWVASRLDSISFASPVREVRWSDGFTVDSATGPLRAQHVSLGVGAQPHVPRFVRGLGEGRVVHSSQFVGSSWPDGTERVLVVGGGQSGAEIVAHLLDRNDPCLTIDWVTRRPNVLPLDESPFVEDLFTPEATREFAARPFGQRAQLLQHQKLASDGVSTSVLERIYRDRYDIQRGFRVGPRLRVTTGTEVTALDGSGSSVRAALLDVVGGERTVVDADVAILATGYDHRWPEVAESLLPRIHLDHGLPVLRDDFSVVWDAPASQRLFVQNGGRHAIGIADPNISLLAWRAATIALAVAPGLRGRLRDPSLLGDVVDPAHHTTGGR